MGFVKGRGWALKVQFTAGLKSPPRHPPTLQLWATNENQLGQEARFNLWLLRIQGEENKEPHLHGDELEWVS